MSNMTPYYFTGSSGMSMSIWMRSNDFQPLVGLALSGSTASIATGVGNAWQFDSPFSCAAINTVLPSNSFYKIEATSTNDGDTGSFELYVSQAATSSVVTTNTPGDIMKPIYSPKSDLVFNIDLANPGPCNIAVVNPKDFTQPFSYTLSNQSVFDAFYNSVFDTIWVWVSGSTGVFFNEYSGDGSNLIASHSFSVNWNGGFSQGGQLAYNPVRNHVMIAPFNSFTAISYSIYDCGTNTVVNQGLPPTPEKFVAYVSSSQFYYMYVGFPYAGFKVNAQTFTGSIVASLTGSAAGSGFGLGYIDEVDKLFFENSSSTIVFNPSNDSVDTTIPASVDFQFIVFDPCRNCLVISDDGAGDPSFTVGGGLCYVSTGSYQPLNFVNQFGVFGIVYANSSSAVFYNNYYDATLRAVVTSIPTGSLPQPPFPSPTPTASANCVAPWFTPYILTGNLSSPAISFPFTKSVEATQSLSVWSRSTNVDTSLRILDPSRNTIGSDLDGGWIPAGDSNNSAVNVSMSISGTFSIELTSSNAAVGTCSLYISPGPERKVSWAGRRGLNVFYISSSNCIGVVAQQNKVVFYSISSSTIINTSSFAGGSTMGGAWSATQDRVFVWASDTANNLIAEYDHTGSLITSHSIEGPVFWGGVLCYDQVHDHLLLIQQAAASHFAIWDNTTKTILFTGSHSAGGQNLAYCTYSDINNKFYVTSHFLGNADGAVFTIDASTFIIGNPTIQAHDFLQYIPVTKRIVLDGGRIYNPVSDTVTNTFAVAVNSIIEGAVYDACSVATVIAYDIGNPAPNSGGLIVLDSQYNPVNFVAMYNTPAPDGGTSQFMYGLCYADSDSKMYITTDDFGNDSSSLWSGKVSSPTDIISF